MNSEYIFKPFALFIFNCAECVLVPMQDYITGLRGWFEGYTIVYALIKTVVFALLITNISGFEGYSVKGGAIQVGEASTRAVVWSSIMIILFNLILTQLLLS